MGRMKQIFTEGQELDIETFSLRFQPDHVYCLTDGIVDFIPYEIVGCKRPNRISMEEAFKLNPKLVAKHESPNTIVKLRLKQRGK